METLMPPAYKSTNVLVILSPSFRERQFCVQELNTFMSRWRNGDRIRVLPALWRMDRRLVGYHRDVDDLIWIPNGWYPVDYSVQTLWPSLVRELGLPEMTREEFEKHLSECARSLQGGAREIPAWLHTFPIRQHGSPKDPTSTTVRARHSSPSLHRVGSTGAEENMASSFPRHQRPPHTPKSAREAIVYLPSILPFPVERDFVHILASSLVALRRDVDAIKVTQADTILTYGNGRIWQCKKYTISLEEKVEEFLANGQEIEDVVTWQLVDVYWLDYEATLTGDAINPFLQVLELMGLLLVPLARIVMVLFADLVLGRRTGSQSLQLLKVIGVTPIFFAIAFVCFGLFVNVTIGALVRLEILNVSKDVREWILLVFVLLALLHALDLRPRGCSNIFVRIVTLFSSSVKYSLDKGARKHQQLRNQAQLLLERIQSPQLNGEEHPYEIPYFHQNRHHKEQPPLSG